MVAMAVGAAACEDQQVAAPSAVTPLPYQSPAPPAPAGDPLRFSSIQRLDATTGFVASWNGTSGPRLARTVDAGASWQPLAVPLETVTTVRFIDARVGWVAGLGNGARSAALLHTVDGGATWQRALDVAAAPGGYPPLALQAVDGLVAWALVLPCDGCVGDLGRTTDGGLHWSWLASGHITTMRFATATRGWIAVSDAYPNVSIRVTSDGGKTWNTRANFTSGAMVGLDAANALTAWALIRDGAYCTASICTRYDLERTVDGGLTWQSLGNPKPATGDCGGGALYGPLFATPGRGWLAENTGAGGVRSTTGLLRSVDGGATWRCQSAPAQSGAVSAADPMHIWVATGFGCCAAAVLYSSDDGGQTWRALDPGR
jgi:photosystem II stability/assembly factor-like uncharacterized protein